MSKEIFIRKGFVPERMRDIVRASGLSIVAMANKSHVGRHTIQNWIWNQTPPQLTSIGKIAKVLNVDPDKLYASVTVAVTKKEFKVYRAALGRRCRNCPREGDEERLGHYVE